MRDASEQVPDPRDHRRRFAQFAGFLLLLPALLQVGLLLRVVLARAAYPMDIEWLEGGTLYHAYRVLNHQPLFGPPDQGFLPFTHPPLHYFVLAAAGEIFGLDYATGRGVSILFLLVACAVVALEAARAFPSRAQKLAAASVAAGAAAASFPVVEGVYDLVRNDSIGLGLLLLAALVASDERPARWRTVLSTLLLVVAAFVRLAYWPLQLWILAHGVIRDRRRGSIVAATTLLLDVLVFAALQVWSHGSFFTFAVSIHTNHQMFPMRYFEALKKAVTFAPFLPLLPVLLFVLARRGELAPRTRFWSGMLVAAIPTALLPYAKLGGFENDLVPLVFLAGPVAVLVASDLFRSAALDPRFRPRAMLAGLVLAAVLLSVRLYSPSRFVPDGSRWRRAEEFSAFLASLEGGVLIPNHPFLPVRAGQPTEQFHTMPYFDVYRYGLGRGLFPFLERTGARWVILDGKEEVIRQGVLLLYDLRDELQNPVSTMVGYPSSPQYLFERKQPLPRQRVRVLASFEEPSWAPFWTSSGDAFPPGPLAPPRAEPLSAIGYTGRGFANSFAGPHGDAGVGTLESAPFEIDRSHFGMVVAGGASPATRVELRVLGAPVGVVSGLGDEVLRPVVWDVSDLRGKQATLAIIDDAARGEAAHVLVDQIELFDLPGAAGGTTAPRGR